MAGLLTRGLGLGTPLVLHGLGASSATSTSGAVIILIADAVTTALNAATLSKSFVATRAYVPVYEVCDFASLKVTVVPRGMTSVALTRRSEDEDYQIDIAVQMRVPKEPADIDPYMDLSQEIRDLFRGKHLDGYSQALCVANANEPIYDPLHLDEKQIFTSVIRLTFRVARDQT